MHNGHRWYDQAAGEWVAESEITGERYWAPTPGASEELRHEAERVYLRHYRLSRSDIIAQRLVEAQDRDGEELIRDLRQF